MRNLLKLASLLLLTTAVGCSHTDCGSGCSTGGCGSGCGGGTLSNGFFRNHTWTHGVCDCDIPPLAPYTNGNGLAHHEPPPAPAVAAASATSATSATTETPKEMPKAGADGSEKGE